MSQPLPDVLDRARLVALVDEIGDADLVRETVRMFLDELPDRLSTIRSAVVSGDPDGIRGAAHALRSPAAMLGVDDVARTTKALEAAAASGDGVSLDSLLVDVERSGQLCAPALHDYLASPVDG